jgi:hypothetical protein
MGGLDPFVTEPCLIERLGEPVGVVEDMVGIKG